MSSNKSSEISYSEPSEELKCIDTKEYLCQIIEKKCICVNIYDYHLPFDKLHILNNWMKSCIDQCQKHSSTVDHVKWYHPDGTIVYLNGFKDVVSDVYYVCLSSEDISGILRSIESYNNTYHTYLECYQDTSFERNNASCNDSQYMKFIKENFEKLPAVYSDVWWVYVYQKYIQVVISSVVLMSGILMTGTLLFIFIKHKEMRTEANVVLLHIAICDFLYIVVFYPIYFVVFNGIYIKYQLYKFCGDMINLFTSANAFSIVALSLQRLIATKGYHLNSFYFRLRKVSRIIIFFIFVWAPGIIFTLLSHLVHFQHKEMLYLILVFLPFSLLGLPIAVTTINCFTSWNLKISGKEVPGEQIHENRIQVRYRSAKIVNLLCVVYWVTHGPHYLGIQLSLVFLASDISDLKFKYVMSVVIIMFCLNATLNPLILVVMSNKFKTLYIRYLFRWKLWQH